MKEYLKSTGQVFADTGTTAEGLSSGEATARLEKNGKNKLAEEKSRSFTAFSNS